MTRKLVVLTVLLAAAGALLVSCQNPGDATQSSQQAASATWSGTGVGLPPLGAKNLPQQEDVRRVVDLDSGWRFLRSDAAGAQQPDFNDSGWTTVSLPHTWNAQDGQDGGNNYYRGPGWYRLHLRLGAGGVPDTTGKSLFLRFDAACSVADVYVNGQAVGEHKGMFSAFCFDVTSQLKTDSDNVIAVRVDNAPRPDVPPLSADFTFFGGLYRRAHLLVLDPLSVSPTEAASSGVFLRENHVTPDSADVQAEVHLHNGQAAARTATLKVQVLDASGAAAAPAASTTLQVPPGDNSIMQQLPLHINHPHLWDGRRDPYLYMARVDVMDGDRLTDEVVQPLGLRFFHADADRGFFLNGRSYPIHGVNRHQDRIDMGWAITPKQHEQDFNLIMEMGCTGIRLAHYQHAQDFYDLCDRGGLVVWAESCMVNAVTPSKQFDDVAKQQLKELILQNFNHPSICFWSVYNELGNEYHGNKAERDQQVRDQVAIVKQLNDLAHALDKTRLTTAATDRPEPRQPINLITDVLGDNQYDGWYRGTLADYARQLDHWHSQLPHTPLSISEYGAGASIYQHEANVQKPSTRGPWHPEEYQAVVHEAAWDAMRQRPWLWGTFVWNMFDFASDGRHEGDHAGRNDKGLVTYDRKTKKDAFYFYKANWSDQPFVYITDRRFTPRREADGPVKIYSDCDSVELQVNGQSLGTRQGNAIHIFLWPQVQLRTGSNKLVAIGSRGGHTYQDSCDITVDRAAPTSQSSVPTTP